MKTLIVLIILIAITGGVIYLQIQLSRHRASWPGLLLPLGSFLLSLLVLLGIASFTAVTHTTVEIEMDGGQHLLPSEETTRETTSSNLPNPFLLLFTFLMYNIPTFILLGIYYIQRGQIKTKSQLERMSIQDLE